jgi:hypothetical protein
MRPFVLDQPAQRVIFGAGSIERLADEVQRAGMRPCSFCLRPRSGSRTTSSGGWAG